MLVVEISLKSKRYNPYDEEDEGEEMDNLIGLVEGEIDMGLCYRIDMSYKDKGDQWSDYIIKWQDGIESFEKLCKDLKIEIIYETDNL